MSGPSSRIRSIANHLAKEQESAQPHMHTLSPTVFLERAAAVEPNAQAIHHFTSNGAVLKRTYQEHADRARGLAYYLKKHGFKQVGILATNTPAFLEAIFAVPAAGGVLAPANYRLKHADIEYIFEFVDAECIIVDHEFVSLLDAFKQKHPKVPIIIDTDTDITEGPHCGPYDQAVLEGLAFDRETGSAGWAGLSHHTSHENDTIALPFTSGTTSRPKAVMQTNRGAYLGSLANIIESGLNHNERCKYLWTLPMFHAMGWTFPWAVAAVRGVNYCLRKIDYPLIWKLLKEEGITHYNAAPTVNTFLVASKEASRLPQKVKIATGGSAPSAYLLEQMLKLNLHPIHIYGLTETYGPGTISYYLPEWDDLPQNEQTAKMARQGHAFITGLPVRVIKTNQPEGVLIDVEKNGMEIGEICFTGNSCAKGYYKDPEATRKLFAGGVLHTGDLALWHPDGSIQVMDRAKDIIISGGENISSVALEGMLVEHPDILEAAVVAVSDPNWGERPKAFVTVKDGSKKLTGEEIITWAKDHSSISRFMAPKEIEIVAELPKTGTGKFQKNVLREWAKSGRNAGEEAT